MRIIKYLLQGFIFCFCITAANAGTLLSVPAANGPQHPFYVGVSAGYGATTWNQLVSKNLDAAMTLSTPIATHENGLIWGVFAGYELLPVFALEAAYTRYPQAKIYFDAMSLFAFDNNVTQLHSKTETVSLSGKFMIYLPHTAIRAFSSVGIAGVHRDDFVYDAWICRPTFGVGLNYNITEHIMAEVGANYTAGSGQAEMDPANHYIPFTYSASARLAYRF